MKLNFNPFGHWLYEHWRKSQTFIDYISLKYYLSQVQTDSLVKLCRQVRTTGKFYYGELYILCDLCIPLDHIFKDNELEYFYNNAKPVSYIRFLTYLSNICDKKFTTKQIEYTIENGD